MIQHSITVHLSSAVPIVHDMLYVVPLRVEDVAWLPSGAVDGVAGCCRKKPGGY